MLPSLPGSAFQRLALSNLAAHAAQQVAMAAVPIIAVVTLGATVGQVAWIQFAQMLPFLLFAMPAGVLADRSAPKALLQGGELVRALTLVAVLLVATSSLLNLPLLVALSFLGSIGALAYGVAVPSFTLGLVARHELPAANAKLELARSVAFMGGPALAGALITWAGSSQALGAATALSLAAIWLASTLPGLGRPPSGPKNFRAELLAGARFVWHDPRLRAAMNVSIVYNVAFFIMQTALVPYATHRLGMSAAQIGVSLSAYGVGMICAGLVAPRLARTVPIGRLLTMGILAGLTASLLMLATVVWPVSALVSACFFTIGAAGVFWAVGFTTLRQLITPAPLMGRVTSINALATYGARPLGAVIAGLVGSRFGVDTCFYVVVGAFLVQLTMFFLSPLPATDSHAPAAHG